MNKINQKTIIKKNYVDKIFKLTNISKKNLKKNIKNN